MNETRYVIQHRYTGAHSPSQWVDLMNLNEKVTKHNWEYLLERYRKRYPYSRFRAIRQVVQTEVLDDESLDLGGGGAGAGVPSGGLPLPAGGGCG